MPKENWVEEGIREALEKANSTSTTVIPPAPPPPTIEHQVDQILSAVESAADSLRQIRNAIVFLVLIGLVTFVVSLLTRGV